MGKTMKEASVEAETEETEAPAEQVEQTEAPAEAESSTTQDQVATADQASEGEQQSTEQEQTTTTIDFDPIVYIESLADEKLTDDQRKALKDGFLRQSDYTKKTQALADERKLIDEYRTLKPFIDKVFQNEDLYAQVFGENPQASTESTTGEEVSYPEDPREYAKWVKDEAKKEMREEMERERIVENDRNSASNLDPRLNTDKEFAEEIAGIIALDRDFVEGRKSATQATAEALERHKGRELAYNKRFNQDLQNRIKAKKMVMPRTGSAPMNTSTGSSPQTMKEAAEMAEQEIS